MPEPLPASLQDALADLIRWLQSLGIPATIIGGVAASILGRPRLTRDIDALAILPEAAWQDAMDAADRFGITARIDDPLGFALRSRVLLLRHRATGIDLDVTFGVLPFEQAAVAASRNQDVGGVSVPLPRVEDLLVMKAVARRPRDLEDIRGLLAAHPAADIDASRRWIREFATAMTMPDMLQEFDRLIGERSRR